MATTGSSRSDVDADQAASGTTHRRTHWSGLLGFAALMMVLLGFFQSIEGLAAIFHRDYYQVRASGLPIPVDYTVWGWTHLLVGIALFVAGIGVLRGNVVARTVGVAVAALSVVVNMVFLKAAPAMAMIIVTLDVLVMYALIVHGREREY